MILTAKRVPATLKAGAHMVKILKIEGMKDNLGQPLLSSDEEPGLVITYGNNNGSIAKVYWIGKEKQRYFDRDMKNAGIDNSKPMSKAEAIGKQLYVFIREVRFIDAATGHPVLIDKDPKIEYEIFKSFPVSIECPVPIASELVVIKEVG